MKILLFILLPTTCYTLVVNKDVYKRQESDFEWVSIIECLKKADIPEKFRNVRDKAKGVQYIEEQ